VLDVAKPSVLKSAENITMFLFFILFVQKNDKRLFCSPRNCLKASHLKHLIFSYDKK
jgi:hypothetical protein